MRIARLELKDIGPFVDAVLEIPAPEEQQRGELVIFEGPNGSGKTTLAQAIACAADPYYFLIPHERFTQPPFEELARRARSKEGQASARLEHDDVSLEVQCLWREGKLPSHEGNANALTELLSRVHAAAYPQRELKLTWAAFAYRGHQPTTIVATSGPSEISVPPMRGALSSGTQDPASADFGQLLVNLDYEVAKALKEIHKNGLTPERSAELQRIASSRQQMLDAIARALGEALGRTVTLDIPVGQHAPRVLLDGEEIALDLLGEGMRSTFAWLSDLLVRLHRIPWENAEISALEQDFWLILDEIDQSLHPKLQMRILPTLRRLFPNAHVYVTTHSPFVVASAGEGYVFAIRPDARHRISGVIEPRKLEPGQSLEWVVEEIFGAETGFIDAWTRATLRAHRGDIDRMRRRDPFTADDWSTFLKRRHELMDLNEQVQTVVAMQEVPVQRAIEAKLAEGSPEARA